MGVQVGIHVVSVRRVPVSITPDLEYVTQGGLFLR